METTITVDKAGRMVLPKKVRDELRLEPGDTLDLISGGGQVTLRPSRNATRLRENRGIWIFSAGTPILAAETDRVLEDIRQGRRGKLRLAVWPKSTPRSQQSRLIAMNT